MADMAQAANASDPAINHDCCEGTAPTKGKLCKSGQPCSSASNNACLPPSLHVALPAKQVLALASEPRTLFASFAPAGLWRPPLHS